MQPESRFIWWRATLFFAVVWLLMFVLVPATQRLGIPMELRLLFWSVVLPTLGWKVAPLLWGSPRRE